MSSSSKNTAPINWQEAPDSKLGWNKANPEDAREAKEAKRHKEAEEAEKRAHEAVEAEKRACEVEAQHQEAVEAERRREAEWQKEAERAKEAKKWQCAKSGAGPSRSQGQDSKCIRCVKAGTMCMVGPGTKWKVVCDHCSCNKEKCEWLVTEIGSVHGAMLPQGGEKKKRMGRAQPTDNDNNDNDNDNVVVVSTCKTGKSESRVRETMAQVVDRRMGEIVEELWGLRKGMAAMAKSNQDLTWVLYHRFQSMDTLVDEVQIFGAEGFLPKLVLKSKPAEDKLQEALREVEELQEEHLEWAMERLQMRKGWMQKEEEALTRCLKGKGKEPAKEKE
ncbi:hypothetical protein ID866_12805, partial [Astraeus odoratus]